MKTYIVQFEGAWPVGACAAVVARDRGHAKRLLNAEMKRRGFKSVERLAKFELIDTSEAKVHILLDGEY